MQVDIQTSGIPESIRTLRVVRNLSQAQLADLLGVSRQTVSLWESGASKPSLERIWQMADLFGVTLDELVGRTPREVA